MSGPDEDDTTEEFPELAALLRDEPVEVDPARRDAAVSAALALGAELYPDQVDTHPRAGSAGSPPDDELARRRTLRVEPGPVPAPAHRSRRARPRVLVAAAVLVVAGIGISGLVVNLSSSGNDFTEVANDSGSSSSADGAGGGASQMEDSQMDGGAAAPSSGAASSGDESLDRSPAAGSAEAAPTTTIAAVSGVAGMGEFDSAEAVIDRVRSLSRSSEATADAVPFDSGVCRAELSTRGLVEVGRATVRSIPVLVALEGTSVVVIDVATCAVLAQS